MSLMEQFADANAFESLSMGERLAGATVTMCMGLGITFAILILLWAVIKIMSVTIGSEKKEKKVQAAAAPAPAAAPAENLTDDAQLVAVIAAAIAASENRFVSDIIVRKITRVQGQTNAWNSAGLGECIDSRRM